MPLKPQELRNATFHSAFAKLAETLADEEYWAVNRIITPASIRRMGDIEFMSDLLIGLIHGPQGGSSKIIDEKGSNDKARRSARHEVLTTLIAPFLKKKS